MHVEWLEKTRLEEDVLGCKGYVTSPVVGLEHVAPCGRIKVREWHAVPPGAVSLRAQRTTRSNGTSVLVDQLVFRCVALYT